MIWIILIIAIIIALHFTPDVKEEDYPEWIKIYQERMSIQREQDIVNQIKAEEELAEYKAKHPERFSTK